MLCLVGSTMTNAQQVQEQSRFSREILPILSDRCFTCHGPDSAKRKADLRLDQRDSALKSKAIVPGKASESELIARITSHDPDALNKSKRSKAGSTQVPSGANTGPGKNLSDL